MPCAPCTHFSWRCHDGFCNVTSFSYDLEGPLTKSVHSDNKCSYSQHSERSFSLREPSTLSAPEPVLCRLNSVQPGGGTADSATNSHNGESHSYCSFSSLQHLHNIFHWLKNWKRELWSTKATDRKHLHYDAAFIPLKPLNVFCFDITVLLCFFCFFFSFFVCFHVSKLLLFLCRRHSSCRLIMNCQINSFFKK